MNRGSPKPLLVLHLFLLDAQRFRAQATKYRLLRDYGQELITVATANTHSYRKGVFLLEHRQPCLPGMTVREKREVLCHLCSPPVQMTLCDYVEKVMKPQTYQDLGNGEEYCLSL